MSKTLFKPLRHRKTLSRSMSVLSQPTSKARGPTSSVLCRRASSIAATQPLFAKYLMSLI
ncbi:hypothetical protein Fmac_031029 [Flemingia macrophylla]|uniref:Uncharacterized protein n=1 Tax=Flemingia macrophylla TaxID=520843 RepID=A0ABD1L1D1_9FABA